MIPFSDDGSVAIYKGHAIEVLKQLPDESVQMAVTSPPYWGLRNYSGGSDIVWNGSKSCEHIWGELLPEHHPGQVEQTKWKNAEAAGHGQTAPSGQYCSLCNAWRGQLGLEPTPELYVEHLMMIFREVKRVLRKDGAFYLNIGDTYAASPTGSQGNTEETWHRPSRNESTQSRKIADRQFNVQPKCMVCIPERVMFAMIEDGWILRNKIVWHKPNAMPSSVKDRFTTTWEYVFFFTKARRYYFDLDAVRVPHKTQSLERYQRGVNLDRPAVGKSAEVGPMQQYPRYPQWFGEEFAPDPDYKGKFDDLFGHGPTPQSFNLRVRDVKRGKGGTTAQGGELKASEKEIEEYKYPEGYRARGKVYPDQMAYRKELWDERGLDTNYQFNEEKRMNWRAEAAKRGQLFDSPPAHQGGGNTGLGYQGKSHRFGKKSHGGQKINLIAPEEGSEVNAFHPKGKNPGDYWEITTQPFSTYICPICGTIFPKRVKVCPKCNVEGITSHFAVFPEALCETPIKASSRVEDVVLDMFAGSGTVGVMAKRLGRRAILIDCVKEYCRIARDRTSRVEYQPRLGVE